VKQSILLDPNAEPNVGEEFTTTEKTKLTGIEAGAKADQTGAEIKTAYEAEANAFTDTKNTKLSGIEDGAQPDQTGAEMKTALETLGAGSRLSADKIDQKVDAKFMTDAEETKVAAIDQVYSNTEKTKLTGIEDDATGDQTGAEVRDLIVALGDTERKIIITEPIAGEFPVISIQRDAAGKTKISYDDVPEE